MNPRSHGIAFMAGLVLLVVAPWLSAAIQQPPSTSLPRSAVLSGRVLFEGTLPQEKLVPVYKHREYCGEERSVGRYRVSGAGQVENAVVLLEGESKFPPMPEYAQAVAILDNRRCEFLPRVQVGRPLATLEVRNSDPILHSAHAYLEDGRTAFHVALPHFRDRTRTQLPQSGVIRIECDVGHTWMRAYILISASPFTAVTGPGGTFEIQGIPPGRYRLTTWHEAFGTMEREVSFGEGKHVRLTLVFGHGNAKTE